MGVAAPGATLITASAGPTLGATFTMFVVAQTLYGVGVGGEYPVASSAANERANASKELRNQRGKTVVLVFSNQGLGNIANTGKSPANLSSWAPLVMPCMLTLSRHSACSMVHTLFDMSTWKS